MKNYHCRCGQRSFFDNTECTRCGSPLGFDPASLSLIPLTAGESGEYIDDAGQAWQFCRNRTEHKVCNWLVPAGQPAAYCLACGLNERIPVLGKPENLVLWARLEGAKRRLIYSLLDLSLPLVHGDGPGLRFRFLEDRRRNPDVIESFVSTGHVAGQITINLAEADDVARHEIREQMRERYRTLLGHFRHEAGHFYFDVLVPAGQARDEFRQLFGDERTPYDAALAAYYRDGAPADWSSRHVSGYAAAHPHEDWAETFAHYLHIRDALETAEESGLLAGGEYESGDWILRWMSLSVALNEINRSLGTDDPYPFVLADPVVERLRFIDRRVCQSA